MEEGTLIKDGGGGGGILNISDERFFSGTQIFLLSHVTLKVQISPR